MVAGRGVNAAYAPARGAAEPLNLIYGLSRMATHQKVSANCYLTLLSTTAVMFVYAFFS